MSTSIFAQMYLKDLKLFDFKNHADKSFAFCKSINGISGPNGSGKTNILDAVYYLSNGKSFFNGIDQQVIKHGAEFFSIHGWFGADPDFDIVVSFTSKGKKTIKKNEKSYQRILDHIGLIQTVFITPYDISLVLNGSEERRRFADYTLCQTNREYLETLSFYKKIQDQRNAFLKKSEGRILDTVLLESFDSRFVPLANKIHSWRMEFAVEFLPVFLEIYTYLTTDTEAAGFEYKSELANRSFEEILKMNYERDRILMRTGSGIHKDDFEFYLNGFPLKKYGSQGQIKSYVIALKLAQYRYFLEKTGTKPILLLDDIFEKIDEKRAGKLMELMDRNYFGQIIITDTHPDRLKDHLVNVGGEKLFFEIKRIG